jgi:hypothetical protein
MVYLRLLKEITSNEAWFLDLMTNHSRATIFARPLSWGHYEDAPYFDVHTISLFMDNLPEGIEIEESIPFLLECLECPGVRIFDMDLSEGPPLSRAGKTIAAYGFHNIEHAKVDIATQVLTSLGVIADFSLHDFALNTGKLISMHSVKLTELGAAFLRACGLSFDPTEFEEEITLYGQQE